MQPTLLFYNLDNPKGLAIKMFCKQLNIGTRDIQPSEYFLTLENLLESPAKAQKENSKPPFMDELLVFCHFTNEQIADFLTKREEAAIIKNVDLKAGLTPTNLKWTSIQLYEEILLDYKELNKK